MTNLIILALLRDRPKHGYEIQQYIQMSRMDEWANLLSGSIYYALNKMEKEGLIRTEAEERTGARLRKIYAITEKGEELFQQLVRESLTLTPHSVKSDFALSLNWIETIPREEAMELLGQNLRQLEQTLEYWRQGKEFKSQYGLTPFAIASFDNAIAILEQDISFIYKVMNLLKPSQ
ncbi:PadR family transcriptional regulator [Paenibacillus sp. NEAU-GSW1]|uniref:PadR family transcriptional regulator n=1 Tax=Paenibacillus sp. NEAU-GSW1 TaxID=2682486 RepID=UPI0012E25026|nr:PadR family transcriptional regulator [Paenibacillus sp. NEAU-GSW1]MUT64747.1 PadR family transcriptional regulator [Paenibacillus sp. NEAU-GSW1]